MANRPVTIVAAALLLIAAGYRHGVSCRLGHSRPGRPSARTVTTIAAHCACDSIRKALKPG